jgi:1-aminocyclopropane-1-carboxylate deaminase
MFSTHPSFIIDQGPFEIPGTGVQLTVRRIDLIDEVTGGNKWYKLKYNILEAKRLSKNHIITFGGAFSNHIAATASACEKAGMNSTGIIRGEADSIKNITLSRAVAKGMNLCFVSRELYRKRNDPDFPDSILKTDGNEFIIPEGGSNNFGMMGCKEILENKHNHYNIIAVAAGTGTTAAGLLHALGKDQILQVINVLKDQDSILNFIKSHTPEEKWCNLKVCNDYHFGGYAKSNIILEAFCKSFIQRTAIPVEPIYTGKLFYGIYDLAQKGIIAAGTKILAIHTGGLQYLSGSEADGSTGTQIPAGKS